MLRVSPTLKKRGLSTAASVLGLLLASPSAASAQIQGGDGNAEDPRPADVAAAPADPQAPLYEEIIVTATRVAETSLHETPAAVSAFSDEYIADMIVTDVRDLAAVTPGLTLSANSNMAQVYIRGVGSNNVFAGADPSSTVHYDGVYLARPQSNFANFVDVERVEVLRGPQGTLYGRNSVGGTINIISRRPSTERVKAEGVLTVGNASFYRLEGYLSVPLVTDTFAFSVAGQHSQRDPVRENIAPGGHDVDDEDTRAVRGQVLWKASEAIEAIIRADFNEDESTLYSGSSSPIAPPAGNPPLASSIVGDSRKVALNAPSFIDREAYGASLEVNADLDQAWVLKSLTAYRRNDNFLASDPDTTERDLTRTLLWEDQNQVSQEVNLTGDLGRLQLFLGAFYFREKIDSIIEVQARAAGLSTKFIPDVDTKSWSVFGQAEYDLGGDLTATIGGRYTEETKDWLKTFGTFSTAQGTLVRQTVLPPEQGNYNEFTPKFGLQYEPSEDLLLYGSISRGFKSGGFNITATTPGGYDPETLWAYEIGVNGRLGRRVTSRLSAFHYDYSDLQVQAFITPGVASITNAASARIRGIESETSAQLADSFLVRATAAYLDARYDEYPGAPVGGGRTIDASGNRLSNAPKWALSGMAQYRRELSWGTLQLTGEYGWQSGVFFTVSNDQLHRQGSYGVLNVSAGLESPGGGFGVTLWARNLLDEEYLTSAGTITNPAGRYGPVRLYGVRVRARF